VAPDWGATALELDPDLEVEPATQVAAQAAFMPPSVKELAGRAVMAMADPD
jgi:hypothetical protein